MIYGHLYNKYKDKNIFNEDNISDLQINEESEYYITEEDISIFSEALMLLSSEQAFYSSIVQESFGDSIKSVLKKIGDIITKIIDKFIEILKTIWYKFEDICDYLFTKAGTVEKNKNLIKISTDTIEYNVPHFHYTNTREDSSRTNFDTEINLLYKDFIATLEKIKSFKTKSSIQAEIEKLNAKFSDTEPYYNTVRGKIIGKEVCTSKNFAKELYKYFRAGQADPMEQEIIKPEAYKAMLENLNSKKNIRALKKYRTDIETSARQMKGKYKTTNLSSYISDNQSYSEVSSLYDNCINNHIVMTKNLCNIYLEYCAAKLDAAKEEYSSDIKILCAVVQNAKRKGL